VIPRGLFLLWLAIAAGDLALGAGSAPPAREALPRRVIALAPNLTEIVFALGAGNRLVGVSERSDYPPAAAAIPVVGGVTPDLEKIVSLRPDLVLATSDGNSPATVEILARQGIPVLATSAPDLSGVIGSIRAVAGRLGAREAGEGLARALESRREAVRRRDRRGKSPSAVLLIWPAPPQAAGAGTFAGDILSTAGGENCVPRKGWPVLSPEFLVEAACSVIVYPLEAGTRATFERAFRDGPLSRMAAVRAGRIIGIDGDRLTRPGPRAFDALEDLAAAFDRLP
jgi:iron complex transport system substrate-binding protein